MTIHDEYRAKHAKSAALWERSRQSIPGGITHDIRHLAPFPTYVERAAGTRKWDVDGNEYVDYHGGYGVNVVGHGNPHVVDADRVKPPEARRASGREHRRALAGARRRAESDEQLAGDGSLSGRGLLGLCGCQQQHGGKTHHLF